MSGIKMIAGNDTNTTQSTDIGRVHFLRKMNRNALCGAAFLGLSALSTYPVLAAGTPNMLEVRAEQPNPYGAYMAASFAEADFDYEQAADMFDIMLGSRDVSPSVTRRAMLANLNAGRIQRAVDLARPQAAFFPGQVDIAALTLAVDAVERGLWPAVTDYLDGGRRLGLTRFAAPILAAFAHQANSDIDAAIEALAALRSEDGQEEYHDVYAGLIFLEEGRLDAADAILSPYGERLEEARFITIQVLARVRLAQGNEGLTRTLLETYNDVHGGVDIIQAELDALNETGALPALIEGPKDAIAYTLADLARQVRGQAPQFALRYAQLSLYLNPDNDLARVIIGRVLDSQERFEEAIAVLRAVPNNADLFIDARLDIANALIAIEEDEEAIEIYQAMADADPADVSSLERIGYVMRLRERFAEGVEVYTEAIERVEEITEDHWTLFYHRGITLEREKRWEEAEADFFMALELSPDQPYVLNYLGYSWVDQGIKIERALDMIQTAVNQQPNDGYIVDSLGWAYYKLEDWDKAVLYLERAVQLRPQDPIINDHLGDAYWKAGRKLEAKFQWSRALSLDPTDEERVKIEAKRENGLDG